MRLHLLAYPFEVLALPLVRAGVVLERSWLTPRIREQHEPERVRVELRYLVRKLEVNCGRQGAYGQRLSVWSIR